MADGVVLLQDLDALMDPAQDTAVRDALTRAGMAA
jgi:hypothetical protein